MPLSQFLSALLLAVPMAAHASPVRWAHFPGIAGVNNSGIAVLDIDGDNHAEGFIASNTSMHRGMLSVIGERGGPLARVQVVPVEGEMIGKLLGGETQFGGRLLAQVEMPDNSVFLVEFGGFPLEEIRRTPLAQPMGLISLADVDGDGSTEILALQGNYWGFPAPLVILDLATMEVEWMDVGTAHAANTVQLDEDVALEIVVAGSPGRVIDGATRATEWTYPPGISDIVVVGELDLSVDGTEFASMGHGQSGIMLTLFRGAPYSPLREVQTNIQDVQVAIAHDLDDDGSTEIIFTPAIAQPEIRIRTPATGLENHYTTPGLDIAAIAAGNMSGSTHAELLVAAYPNMFVYDDGRDAARVIDSASGAMLFALPKVTGGHSWTTVGDVDADGRDEVLYPLVGGSTQGRIDLLCSLDIDSGRRKRCLDIPGSWITASDVGPALGRFNELPGEDVAVLHWQRLSVHDGASFAQLWERQIADENTYFVAMETMLFNDDDISDIVVVTRYAQVQVFDGRDGVLLWQSVTLAPDWPSQMPALLIADVDNDETQEILVSAEATVYSFDSNTRLLDWSHTTDMELSNLTQWGLGDACRLAVYDGQTGHLRTLRCDDQSQVGTDRTLPVAARSIRVLDSIGDRLLVAAAGKLHTISANDAVTTWTDTLGDFLGAGDRLNVIPGTGDAFDVVAGTEASVIRVRIDASFIFSDTFDNAFE